MRAQFERHDGRAAGPVRIAHLMVCLDRGGAETVSLDLCRAIPPGRFAQTFITLGEREGTLAEHFRAAGAEVIRCPLRPLPLFVPRLWRCLRAIRPHVVVAHLNLGSGLMLPVAWAAGVPVRVARMWSEGDDLSDSVKVRIRRALLRWLLRVASTDVVGVTAAALAFARPVPHDTRYRVLYNSVDLDRVVGVDRSNARERWRIPPDAPLLVHIGRAHEVKNRPFLIEVLRSARSLRADTLLLVVGSGGIDDLLAVYPRLSTEEPAIVLAGELDDVRSVLAAADVLLLPSRREGLPGVVLEALAAGVPVVANDLPCMAEIAERVDGVRLVAVDDGPQRWAAEALRQAANLTADRQRIRQSLLASPFLLQRAVAEWQALWGR
jgi:glycosyltransferase involved in cell wall biosynthesis